MLGMMEAVTQARKNAGRDLRAGRVFTLKERGQVGRYRLALDEIYDGTAPVHERLRRIPAHADAGSLLSFAQAEARRLGKWPGLVIYPADGPADAARRRVLTEQVLLKSDDVSMAERLAADNGLRVTNRPAYAPQHIVTAAADPVAAVDIISALGESPALRMVEPLLMRQAARKVLLDDPYLQDQWHLKNTGQVGGQAGVDIGIEDVWADDDAGSTLTQGQGIRIAIVDDSLQITHPDLIANVDTLPNHYDWNGADMDPSPDTERDFHGTAVGGLVAARGNNNLGVSGVAPKATLVGFRLIAGLVTDETEAESATRGADIIQVKNNSWGIADIFPSELGTTGALMGEAMATAATAGRGGLGTVSVWASGNGRQRHEQGNKDGYANSIYCISVGAVTNKGTLAVYSETGSHLSVVGPSAEWKAGIVTTDLAGVAGYNSGSVKNISSVDYTNTFNGTSAAAPIVSGVVALMLQANPQLNWRDVKEILLRSSTKLAPKDKGWVERRNRDAWEQDLPPIKHHHSYGGGLVHAGAAVAMAKTWPSLGQMLSIERSGSPATNAAGLGVTPRGGTPILLPLPEETKPKITSSRVNIDFSESTALRVENVTVNVTATHARKGDMTIRLISPSGTISTLAFQSKADTGADYSDWTFSSMRHWGESSRGVWSVVATEPQDSVDGTLGAVTITLHGTSYPAIELTTTPEALLVPEGTNTAFTGATTQYGTVTQQWLKNGKALPNATGNSLSFSPAQLTDAAAYTYTANNLTGSVEVLTALGVVRQAVPSVQVLPGRTATFKTTAAGPALRYQWLTGSTELRDNGRITGSRGPTLTIRNVSAADEQDYYCRISLLDAPPVNTAFSSLSLIIPPTLAENPPPETGIVSGFIEYAIQAENGATSYRAIGLPPGLKLNAKTGLITGRPTRPSSYPVTLIATNSAGSSTAHSFTWIIEDLPAGTVGSYRGLVEPSPAYNDGFGGTFTLTIGKTGSFSGVLTRGKIRTAFKGMLDTYAGEPYATGTVRIPGASAAAPLSLTFSLFDGGIDGSVGLEEAEDAAAISALRQWTTLPTPLGALPGLYNVPLTTTQTTANYPLGSGFLSVTLTSTGRISYTGRLADGTAITAAAAAGQGGTLPVHHMLYGNAGSLQGSLTLTAPVLNGFGVDLDWLKKAQPGSRSYAGGFPQHRISGTGDRYTPPAADTPVLGLPLTALNARVVFSEGGLFTSFTQSLTITGKNIAQFPLGMDNPHQLSLTINAKTGLVTGKGKAMDIDPGNPALMRQRPGSSSALIIPLQNRAEGHFLLPENTAPDSPIRSGKMILR